MCPGYTSFADLPESEREIGKRVQAVRNKFRLSQAKLAPIIDLTRDQLNNVEIGRVALRFGAGWLLCNYFDINPLWLALGPEEAAQQEGFADLSGIEERFDKLFSLVVENLWHDSPPDWPGYERYRSETLKLGQLRKQILAYERQLAIILSTVPPEKQRDFLRMVYRVARFLTLSHQTDVLDFLTFDLLDATLAPMAKTASRWKALRRRLQRATATRGAKSKLARDLGVRRQFVTQWLKHADRGPSGETTLRLLEWVKASEAKQKNAPEVPSTRPAPKTRERKSKHEKPNSDRKKK